MLNLDTPCKFCAFATYDGITQIGCAANILDVFRQQDVEILEAYDNDAEFYVIKDRKCLMYRPKKWLEYDDVNNLVKIARNQLSVHYEVIIPIIDGHTIEDVSATVDSIIAQTIQPQRVVFVVKQTGKYKPSDFRHLYTGKWTVQLIMEEDADIQRMVDICLATLKRTTMYVATMPPGTVLLPNNFIQCLDYALFDLMQNIVYVECDSFAIAHKALIKELGRGNIQHKIYIYLEENPECRKMIKTKAELLAYQ